MQEVSSIENMPFFQYVSQIHKFHSIVLAWNPINIFSTTEQESKEWMLTLSHKNDFCNIQHTKS